MSKKNIHHRLPHCFGGKRTRENTVKVRKDLHQCFHQLFSINGRAMTTEEIANELNNVWCDPRVKFVVMRR